MSQPGSHFLNKLIWSGMAISLTFFQDNFMATVFTDPMSHLWATGLIHTKPSWIPTPKPLAAASSGVMRCTVIALATQTGISQWTTVIMRLTRPWRHWLIQLSPGGTTGILESLGLL